MKFSEEKLSMLDWKIFIDTVGLAFRFISNLPLGPKFDTKRDSMTLRTNFSKIWYKLFLNYK